MRFVWFLTMLLAVANLIIVALSVTTGKNFYQEYGKQMLSALGKFILVLVAVLIAFAISGIN